MPRRTVFAASANVMYSLTLASLMLGRGIAAMG
jgi:hypothetical protein